VLRCTPVHCLLTLDELKFLWSLIPSCVSADQLLSVLCILIAPTLVQTSVGWTDVLDRSVVSLLGLGSYLKHQYGTKLKLYILPAKHKPELRTVVQTTWSTTCPLIHHSGIDSFFSFPPSCFFPPFHTFVPLSSLFISFTLVRKVFLFQQHSTYC
jgi:hypothetical protein